MDHIRLQPLQGQSGREPTAVTHKSIKELLAEEGIEVSDAPLMPAATPEPDVELSEDVRVFDHKQLQPLKGTSATPEPTAITHKSIQELLAEEGVDINDMPLMQADTPDPEPVDAAPDHDDVTDGMADEPYAETLEEPDVQTESATAAPQPSLLGRLFGG